jgi:hypothetical protein
VAAGCGVNTDRAGVAGDAKKGVGEAIAPTVADRMSTQRAPAR